MKNMNNGQQLVEELLTYAKQNGLVKENDLVYTRNQLLEILGIDEAMEGSKLNDNKYTPEYVFDILNKILDYCYDKGIIPENTLTYRDLLDTKIMGVFMPKPSEIERKFSCIKKEHGAKAATDYFYHLSIKSNYVRMERIMKNIKWNSDSPFGKLEITINMTKPEKDPKEIATLKKAKQSGYPKCMLCIENVGYSGRIDFPARQTLRTIPIYLNKEKWHLQYSPYVYYREHCIVLNEHHVPMKLNKDTFIRLFEFIKQYPHYFIGSNADLPIVGGSILNHDHFQGGHYIFPMEKANIEYKLQLDGDNDIEAAIINWPMSVVRLCSNDYHKLICLANDILVKWREYEDKASQILAFTIDDTGQHTPHNTITPIARRKNDGRYELDLVLRNNRSNSEHPLGIFHPHEDLHHIKKENIGLIEVMGLFILPGRLNKELKAIMEYLTSAKHDVLEIQAKSHYLNHHFDWVNQLIEKYGTNNSAEDAKSIIQAEVGSKCQRVLSDAGVFKADKKGRKAFNKFLAKCGLYPL